MTDKKENKMTKKHIIVATEHDGVNQLVLILASYEDVDIMKAIKDACEEYVSYTAKKSYMWTKMLAYITG